MNEAEITIEPIEVKSPGKKHARHSSMDLAHSNPSISQLLEKCVSSTDTCTDLEDHCQLDGHTKDGKKLLEINAFPGKPVHFYRSV